MNNPMPQKHTLNLTSNRITVLLVGIGISLLSQQAFAQQATDQFGIGATQSQKQSFSDLVSTIQRNEEEINRLFSSLPIGFPEKQKESLEKIERLKELNNSLSGKLDDAAYMAYELDPRNNVKAGQLVFRHITRMLDPPNPNQQFDPTGALKTANMMMRVGLDNNSTPNAVQFKDVAYQAFRASYALQDFDRAKLMLDKISAQGIEIRPSITAKLSDTIEKWRRELLIRRHENESKLPVVKVETTEGAFKIELFENHAPKTVGNFISLVEKGFYDEKPFFLVQPGKFAQSGCPVGDGSGDAGYRIPCECEREKIRHHFTGTVSMANAGKDTASSQFFITQQPNSQWDGRYTAFGRITEGMDVIYKLKMVDKTKLSSRDITPSKINRITVQYKRPTSTYSPTRIPKSSNRLEDGSFRTVQGSDGN